MNEKQPVPQLLLNTITLEEAKKRTHWWRKAIRHLYGTNPHKMPHGFFLHMTDIRELAKLHEHVNQEIEGVRIYFTFDKEQECDEHKCDEHKHYPDTIRGILVPVYKATVADSKDPWLRDLIVPVNRGPEGDDPTGEVSIFDVTKPCPPMCDTTSPLYTNTKGDRHLPGE